MQPILPQWFQQAGNTRKEGACGKDGNAPEPGGLVSELDKSDEDVVNLLDESEALELVEFDPSLSPKDSWEPLLTSQ